MISSKVGHSLDPFVLKVCRILFSRRTVHPNLITILGTALSFLASLCIGLDRLVWGALLLLLSGLCDLMDGALARSTNRVTAFGGFLDSVLDRYSDLLVMGGMLIYFMRRGAQYEVVASCIAAIGVAIIPYARARAEAAGLSCKTGLLERPERLIIIFWALLFNVLPYAVFALALLTHVTVIQRILYVRRETAK